MKSNTKIGTDLTTEALNNLPVPVILFDNKQIYFINKIGLKILGTNKQIDFIRQKLSVFDFLLPEYQKSIRINNLKILSGKPFERLDFRIKNMKGEILHMESYSNRIEFNGKKVIQATLQEITNRKNQETELNNIREQFSIISNNAHDILYFFSYLPKPHYLYVSPSVENVLGYKVESFYKDPFFLNKKTIGRDNELKKHEKQATQQQKKGTLKQKRVTYKIPGKDGKEMWMEDHILPIKDEKGKIKFVFGIVRNITDLKEKEAELSQRWNDYRTMLDQSPMAYFIHRNGHCELCNKEAVRILKKRSADNLYGKNLIKYIVPEQRGMALERLKEALEGKDLDFIPYQVTDSKGKKINVELKSVPIIYRGNKCVLTIMQDVTSKEIYAKEKLRAELAEEHNKNLMSEIERRNFIEAKLQTVFNTSTHIIWSVNTQMQLTSFNRNYHQQISQYYNVEIKEGISFRNLYKDILTKKEFEYWMGKYNEAFKGENVLFETEKELENGEKIYREIYLNPTKNSRGKVVEVVAISHNITLRKQTEKKVLEQNAKLNAIFESSSHLVWTVNEKFELTYFNNNYKKIFRDKYGIDPVLGKMAFDFIPEQFKKENKNLWHPYYETVLKGKQIVFERRDKNNDGEEVFREVFLSPIKNENGKVFEIACLAHDITENKRYEKQSIEQASKIKAIFESGSHIMWTLNRSMEYSSFNKNFAKAISDLYGVLPEINKKLIYPSDKDALKEYEQAWNGKYEAAFSGKTVEFISERTNKNGVKVYRQIYLHPIYNNKEVVEVSGMGIDITDKIASEQKVINQAAKLKAVFDGGSHFIWTTDKNNYLTSFNKKYFELIKSTYNAEPKVGANIGEPPFVSSNEYNEWWNTQVEKVLSGESVKFETVFKNETGGKIYLDVFLSPIYQDNEIIEVSGIAHDITERVNHEERVNQSLREKEVLLKEVHHRVKNNMQVISSILNLQSSYVTDEYALNLLKESQNRIKTMAYIHESLYQNKTFSSINFSEYISTLTNNILQSYAAAIQKVKLELDVQKIILNLDTSIPAGLIINELVTNSIKHAFTGSNEGIIYINLYTKDNVLFLEVSDNGKGFPKEVDFRNTNSLGLQLVNTLVEQLDGKVELKSNEDTGTSFYINFPM